MSFKSQYFFIDTSNDSNYYAETKPNINYEIVKKKTLENRNKNTFPLAWTCYKDKNKWVCPMRGDK